MRMHRSMLVVFVGTACSSISPPPPSPEVAIQQPDVERIITVLASDAMQGRRAFTPAADRAAQFIRDRFAAIGLEPLAGAPDYLQRFPVYTARIEGLQVTLNGTALPAENVFGWLATESVRWTEDSDVEVIRVGRDDDARAVLRAASRGDGNRLVIMHPSHRNIFDFYHRFRSGESRALERGNGPNVIVALAETAPTSFDVSARASVTTEELQNVVGVIPGRRRDEIVVFSGHYDHVGIGRAQDGDSIYNGANDNASGTTAVITLAQYFRRWPTPARTLMFVAFAAEEPGGYGSRYFSSRVDPDRVVAMLNMEMIGKPGKDGPNSAWMTGFYLSTLGPILQRAVEGTPYTFYPDPYPDENLFFRSDNATLARLGVPAHTISTTPIDVDPDYHQASDQVETLDLAHLTATIRAIATGARTIVSGDATPSRIDTE